MNDQYFINLIIKLRDAQKMYDRTKHSVYYSEIRSIEKSVDIYIAAHVSKVQEWQSPAFSFSETDPKPHGY